jgi:hypothetical protein
MTEHFGFEQFVRNSGTIDGDEVASGADRLGVNRMGDNFFSATAFARDEDGGIGGRHSAHERAQFHDSWMIANEIAFNSRPSDCDREIRPRFHPQKTPRRPDSKLFETRDQILSHSYSRKQAESRRRQQRSAGDAKLQQLKEGIESH